MILLVVLESYDLICGIGRLWSYWWYWKAMILFVVLEGYDLIGGTGRL